MPLSTDSTTILTAKLEAQVESVRSSLIKLQDQLIEGGKTIAEYKARLNSLESNITSTLSTEFDHLKALIEPLSASIQAFQTKIIEFNAVIERHQSDLTHIDQQQTSLQTKIDQVAVLVFQVDMIKGQITNILDEHEKDVVALQNEFRTIENRFEEMSEYIKKLQAYKSVIIAIITAFAGAIGFAIMVREHILQFMSG